LAYREKSGDCIDNAGRLDILGQLVKEVP